MAQFARPASDIATGGWTATPLWSKINEGAPGNDVVITSGNNTNGDNADVALSAIDTPESGDHILRVRWRKSDTGGHTVNAVCELWEGTPGSGTLRATLTVNDISNTFQTSTYTLSGGEAAAIGDYTNLSLRISRQGSTGGGGTTRRSLVVDFAELETPTAALPTPTRGAVSHVELEAPEAEEDSATLTVKVLDADGTIRATRVLESGVTTTREVLNLTPVEVDSFTDISNLSVELTKEGDQIRVERLRVAGMQPEPMPDPVRGRVSFGEFEVPDAPPTLTVRVLDADGTVRAVRELSPDESTSRTVLQLTAQEIDSFTDIAELSVELTKAGGPVRVERLRVLGMEPSTPPAPRGRVSHAAFEVSEVTTRGRVSAAELEVPIANTRGRLSWTEFEAPIAQTHGRVSFVELQTPELGVDPTRGRVSWTELETPQALTRGRVSFTELETPLSLTQGRVSFAALETPLAITRGRASWAELETPLRNTRGLVSFAELQLPLATTRGRASWAALEVPEFTLPPTRGQLSHAEFEVPLALRGQMSFAEFGVPFRVTHGRVSFTELELPYIDTHGRVSFAALEIPLRANEGRISHAQLEIPFTPILGRVSFLAFQVPEEDEIIIILRRRHIMGGGVGFVEKR